jgi:hypothetical protein
MPARVGSESGSGRFGAYVGLLCDTEYLYNLSVVLASTLLAEQFASWAKTEAEQYTKYIHPVVL